MTVLHAEGKQGLQAFIYWYGVKPRLDIKAGVERVASYQVEYATHIS